MHIVLTLDEVIFIFYLIVTIGVVGSAWGIINIIKKINKRRGKK